MVTAFLLASWGRHPPPTVGEAHPPQTRRTYLTLVRTAPAFVDSSPTPGFLRWAVCGHAGVELDSF